MNATREDYLRRIRATLRTLGTDPGLVERRGLPVHPEARSLTPIGLGTDGRDKFATPATAVAWFAMRAAAADDGIMLLLHSAYRGFDYQLALIHAKLARGQPLEDVLRINAPAGCSEHHTGRALDLGCPDTPPLEESFETTPAFAWLRANAPRFGFRLSFPRDNPYGFLYEPWHWYFRGRRDKR